MVFCGPVGVAVRTAPSCRPVGAHEGLAQLLARWVDVGSQFGVVAVMWAAISPMDVHQMASP